MIQQIIELFYKQAKEHKGIKSFYYGRVYDMGSGEEQHPLFWLEDPISGGYKGNLFECRLDFAILFLPKNASIEALQNYAFSFGLNILERIKKEEGTPCSITAWDYTTLREYYDNNACGCRFSVSVNIRNPQNLCLIAEQFDKDKDFDKKDLYPKFNINPANKCETFVNGLPVFDLKTSR